MRKHRLKKKSFSKAQLALFMSAFALIGGFILLHSFAAGSTANLWVDTNGGSCTRQSSPGAYNDAGACSSMQAALAACQPGDAIIMKAGTYVSQSPSASLAAPGCTIDGETGTTIGGLNTSGSNYTISDITVDVGSTHDAGWGNSASNITLNNVNLHGLYVRADFRGNGTNVTWNGGELGQQGSAGKRSCNTGDVEPVVTTSTSHITFSGVTFWPADFDSTPCSGSSNGFHLEMIRIDSSSSFITIKNSTFPSGQRNNSNTVFITDVNNVSDPNNLSFSNNFFGTDQNPVFGVSSQTVQVCSAWTFAYNTFLDTPGDITDPTSGAGCSSSFNNVLFVGNLGPRPGFYTCNGTFTKNVWQMSIDNHCGTDKAVIGTQYATDQLGLTGDGFHISATSPGVDAAETSSCASVAGNKDHDGDTRPQGAVCDAGADEYGSGSGFASGINVSGNQLLKDGQPFIMRGVNRSGTEYSCIQNAGIFDGPNATNDDAQVPLMKAWGINTVNIPLNEDCWLGINGAPAAYSGTNYINAIKHEVATLEANGITPVLAMFWTATGTNQALDHDRMVDASHGPALWQSIANTFKTDPYAVFRLKEEPHDIGDNVAGWQCLMLGDVQYDTSNTLTPVSSTAHCGGLTGFSALGMQSMINIVRGTGANNVIQVSGTEYSNSMTHFLDAGIKPSDPHSPAQLMAAVDTYPDGNACGSVTCYDSKYAPVAAVMPFVSGEVGDDPNCAITNMSSVDTYLNWLDAHNAGYLAWTWDTWGGSCQLISSYNTGAAKSPWGVDFKAHLASVNGATDSTPPTVSLTAPTAGATVSGSSVTVSANASDNVGVAGVQFKVDGTNIGSEDTTSPYSITWDTTSLSNGSHTLTAVARDAAGNTTTSSSVSVTVNNSPSCPTGDANSDCHVTIVDLSILLSHYGQSGQTTSTGDFNGDGSVTILDLSILLSHYGL